MKPCAIAVPLTCALIGCGDPTAQITPPESAAMAVLMVVDLDDTVHAALVTPIATGGSIRGLSGTVSRNGAIVAMAAAVDPWDDDELGPCQARYGTIVGTGGEPRCLAFRFVPQGSETYDVGIQADARPALSASTTVPGPFSISSASATGSAPRWRGVAAAWTSSASAYRYMVGLRAEVPPWCPTEGSCSASPDREGWSVVTTDTTVNAQLEAADTDDLAGAEGPWYVEVYAMDRSLFRWLTTGIPDEYFPATPVSNVASGYGVVGSWVRRSMPVP